MQLHNGERIFEIGTVLFEFIHNKRTHPQKYNFPLYNISVNVDYNIVVLKLSRSNMTPFNINLFYLTTALYCTLRHKCFQEDIVATFDKWINNVNLLLDVCDDWHLKGAKSLYF